MKIYVDWERREFYSDRRVLIEQMLEDETLASFRNYLEEHYYIEEVFELNKQEKKQIRKDYENYLEKDFETYLKNSSDYLAVLEVDSIEETLKELN